MYKRIDAEAVPISRAEVAFKTTTADHKKSVSIMRKQFPLVLSWAVTIHKVQGMTMDRIVVDMTMSKGKLTKGQCYIHEFQSNSNVLYLINCGNKSKSFLSFISFIVVTQHRVHVSCTSSSTSNF